MSRIIAVVGDTGVGKSSSIQYLDPKETYVINVAGKGLPFKGSNKLYSVENKNYAEIDDTAEVLKKIQGGFAVQAIQTGILADGFIQVMSGLDGQDSVAADAQFLMDSESFIKVKQQ